jgi:hypothetical protein
MSSEVYAITDIDGYLNQMRQAAARALSDNSDQDNLDDFISMGQMKGLFEEYCLGFDNQDRPLLNQESNERIFEETSVWIHSVALAKLAAKDMIECCWDSTNDEMVFWQKENNKNEQPKPKRKRKNI